MLIIYYMPSTIPSNMFISFCLIPSAIKMDLFFHLTNIVSAVLRRKITLTIRTRILNKRRKQSSLDLKSIILAAE